MRLLPQKLPIKKKNYKPIINLLLKKKKSRPIKRNRTSKEMEYLQLRNN